MIWEFTSSAAQSNHLDWYPGDDVVDMVGLDIYTDPSSSMSGEWYDMLAHYNGRKMIALSESGTLPNADLMDLYGNHWNYFSLWTDDFLDDFTAQQVQTLLNDEDIITLNELPLMPWSALDFNRDGASTRVDYVVWRKTNGQTGPNLKADANLDGIVNNADFALLESRFRPSSIQRRFRLARVRQLFRSRRASVASVSGLFSACCPTSRPYGFARRQRSRS